MTVPDLAVVGTGSAAVIALAFDSSDTLAVTAAIAALITTIGAVTVNVIVALRTSAKVDEVKAETKVITGHVNSAATASTQKIDALQKELAQLRVDLAEKKQDAALLAQAKATADSVNPVKEPML